MKQNPLMYAIIGDIVGSIYEFPRDREVMEEDLEILTKDYCKFTDDTVHTIAIAEAILKCPENPDFTTYLKKWTNQYPKAGYGHRFRRWIAGEADNNSFGNGAYMRISPIYWAYNSYIRKAMMATSIASSHNHPCSYLFLDCLLDPEVPIVTPFDLQKDLISGKITLEKYRKHYHFDSTCQGSVPEAIYIARTAKSYEDCLRQAILLGGDTDTQAAIAGGIYGFLTKEEIPEHLYNWAWDKLPKDIQTVLNDFARYLKGALHKKE